MPIAAGPWALVEFDNGLRIPIDDRREFEKVGRSSVRVAFPTECQDKSKQRLRRDKLSWEEFEKLVDYFSNDPRIQAYLTLVRQDRCLTT